VRAVLVASDAYAYVDAGQLAVETQSVAGHPAAMRTLTHTYDADGLRTGLVYPGGKVLAAGYTARGQLATMTFHGQPVATSTYRPNGQPIGTVYGNGAQRTLSYDAAGRLTGTGTNVGAATITGRGYALDAVGRRTGYVDETAANAVFSYDPAGQVLGGTVPVPGQPASVNTYAYDPEGNRTQSSTGIQPAPADPVTITGSTTYTANPLNQYTAITGNPNPTYDADGNLLSGLRSPLSVFTSTWNGENRMLSSTSANVAITDRRVENAYDALGRRVRKTVKFASTGAVIEDRYFIYDGWNVIEETIAPATGPVETAEHVWGTDLSGSAQGAGGVGGLLLRESSATGASYYHYDGNGNVTALTSTAGTIQAAYTYGPFGETLRAVGPLAQANPWRFSTKYQDDETGLLYYGYRFYNPTDGRWLNRDPIGEDGGMNLYGFLNNSATKTIDPDGRMIWFNLDLKDCKVIMRPRIQLIFKETTYYSLNRDGTKTKKTSAWTKERKSQFRTNYKNILDATWNNQNYLIKPRSNAACCPCQGGMSPKLDSILIPDGAWSIMEDYEVSVNAASPELDVGRTNKLGYGSLGESSALIKGDNTIPHEFGHSLGLDHPGGASNEDWAYEFKGKDQFKNEVDGGVDMMGKEGNFGLRPFYFKKWEEIIWQTFRGCAYSIQNK